jgi:hypothetical protein
MLGGGVELACADRVCKDAAFVNGVSFVHEGSCVTATLLWLLLRVLSADGPQQQNMPPQNQPKQSHWHMGSVSGPRSSCNKGAPAANHCGSLSRQRQ